ncbi:MAG: carboxypeptidase regulatory-like domain-containing protein [Chlorobiaceae bacterium]|nr:carboxypeptidase regulatory-like domain-containing protein [Chlorobiaceae bacterium]
MSTLIGQISVQPPSPRPGQSVRIEVFDNANNPLLGQDVAVSINGVPGAVQYLQFPSAGQRCLIVRAMTPNGESERQQLVNVVGDPLSFPVSKNRNDTVMIGVSQSPTHPYEAVLTVGSFIDSRLLRANSSSTAQTKITHVAATNFRPSALPLKSALQQAIEKHSAAPPRVEVNHLSPFITTPLLRNKPITTVRPIARRTGKVAVATVYDTLNIDLQKIIQASDSTFRPEYIWDFGDGTTQTTRVPMVRHDFFPALDHSKASGQFVITCQIKHAAITVKRTLTMHSAYAICKQTGTVVPHVSAEIFAHKRFKMIQGVFTIYNVEEAPMILDKVSITPTAGDGDALALPSPYINLQRPIVIAPRSHSMVSVNVPFVRQAPKNGELLFNVPGFSVLYAGRTGNYPVRCRAIFDIPVSEWSILPEFPALSPSDLARKPWPWELVEASLMKQTPIVNQVGNNQGVILDKLTGTLAVSLGPIASRPAEQNRTTAVRLFSSVYSPVNALTQSARPAIDVAHQPLISASMVQQPAQPIATGLAGIAAVTRDIGGAGYPHAYKSPPIPGPIAEGQICDPDNLTEAELALAKKGHLVCQLTSETEEVLMPARWMNALKGDIILSPGGSGLIGGILMNVDPPQWYSHAGIMTRNYDEITHSTGSEDRVKDHMVGISAGSDGFEPNVLKYVWPGAITQSVQASIEGEEFPDPEYDASYWLHPFSPHMIGVTHNDQMKMIPPLVVKPDPMLDTTAVRTALHAIATDARNAGGRPGLKSKYHYRWYCYTDPTIGLGAPEGPGAGWAVNTRPSVCSSFIWMQAKGRKAHLETDSDLVMPTDLEQTDIDHGAAVRPVTRDGLYTYSAKERSDAANWMYNTIYNEAFDKAGWLGEILTDGADDIANQFLNAFALDNADGKDSSDWQNTVDADAVSPDNILWWDGPLKGGLYGFAEPALYREPRVESYTVSRWKKVVTSGKISGHVYDAKGKPLAGAHVQVYDGKTVPSGADGSYLLDDVPYGLYQLKASKEVDGILESIEVKVLLSKPQMIVNLYLHEPADRYRIAQVFYDFWGRDDEWGANDEILDPGPEYLELELGPDKLVNSTHLTYKWGGELRVEYDITVRLLVGNTIDVEVQGYLYEGTDESTDDLNGLGKVTFQSAASKTAGATLTITNTEEDASDAGVLSIAVKNVRNTN